MLSIFLAPVSAGIQINENKFVLDVGVNEVRAQATGKWYFEYKTLLLGENKISGPFDTRTECESQSVSGTIVRLCFQSDTLPTITPAEETDAAIAALKNTDFGCGLNPLTWHKCIVSWIYYLIFIPISAFARLAAHILDFFIYYSTNSDSYTHTFVEKGWGAIRDIANIFFIVALLYVAIKTILSMNVSNNKRLVGTIILVALVINFSLFTTKVVIDASNVLAKIFYNNITPIGSNGQDISNEEGEKSISLGLVKEFNPQKIFAKNNFSIEKNIGTFAFLLFLSILMMGYMIYIFFSIAFLFLARVVSLWIAMIFSPIAFASLTIEADMGGFGFKKWWSELLKVAFLAPIFIFFLYIIILFGDLKSIVKYGNTNTIIEVNDFQTYMGVLIPFIIIFALLMKAKKLAVEYSGEMGQAITKAGAMVGGLALGAVTGGAAMIGSSTIGKYASKVANNDELKEKAAAGNRGAQRKLALANSVASKSFDFRQTGAGKMLQSKTGLNLSQGTGVIGLGEDKLKGGNKARDVRILEKKEEKLKTYQLSKAEAEKQNKKANDEKEPQNIRAAQYETDLKEAKEKAKNIPSPEKEKWEQEFQKAYQDEFKGRVKNEGVEKRFREEYEKEVPPPPVVISFDENKFKEAYTAGDNEKLKKDFKLDKTVESGSVKKILDAKDTNEERRIAYANSSDNEIRGKEGVSKNTKVRKFVNRFYDNWREGFGETLTLSTPTALTATGVAAVAGVMTGGVGLALAPVFGGFLRALKEQFKEGNRSTNAELVAGIRKGMDKKEKALKDIAAAFGGDLNLVANATKVAAKKEPVIRVETPEPKTPNETHQTDDHGTKSY